MKWSFSAEAVAALDTWIFLTARSHADVSSIDCHFHGDIYLNGDTKSIAVKAVTALHLPARAPRSGTHERFERAALRSQ